jgi:hypothetical protein
MMYLLYVRSQLVLKLLKFEICIMSITWRARDIGRNEKILISSRVSEKTINQYLRNRNVECAFLVGGL